MPQLPHCFYRISIKALILDDSRRKFLLTQKASGMWDTPGGGLEHGELPEEGLCREIKEEMGLALTWIAEKPSFFVSSPKKDDPSCWLANVFYEVHIGSLAFTPSDECVAARFVTPEEALALPAYTCVHKLARLFASSKKL